MLAALDHLSVLSALGTQPKEGQGETMQGNCAAVYNKVKVGNLPPKVRAALEKHVPKELRVGGVGTVSPAGKNAPKAKAKIAAKAKAKGST